jgi:subtilisin family serine protease
MPEEEVRAESSSSPEPLEQSQEAATRDAAVGESHRPLVHEQPEETLPSPAATSAEGGSNVMPTVSSRQEQFLIARKSGPLPLDVQPVDLSGLEQALKAGAVAGAVHVRTLSRRGRVAMEALSVGTAGTDTIVVAEMPPQVADQLRQHPGLLVEPDHPLVYAQPTLPVPLGRDPGVVMPYGTGFTVSLTILGDGGTPLAGAEVYLYGRWWPVQYPATSPHVLAVAAIGKQGEFPPESYHGTQALAGNGRVMSSEGFFSARFTCFGPEIGVCAPGVAILSSVPPDNFAIWDGTSMAAPHVTGLAALGLAHHADFQGAYTARNAARVERLFQILKQSAQPLNLGDPYRVGAGLPDALQALSLAQPAAASTPASIDELVRQLLEMLRRGSMPVGAGGGATSGAGATLQDLQAVMRQTGLLAGGGGAVTPASSRPNGEQTTLQGLKATLQQVGLL